MGGADLNRRIALIDGDITAMAVDVIVNAANEGLLGGGGVDGAIHRVAGPELLEACKRLGGCKTGAARITRGYRLPAKHIIHTVGPVWRGGTEGEAALLAQCYRRALGLLVGNNLTTIAFPAISTGAYGYPADQAARVAVDTVADFLDDDDRIEKVTFCCFGGPCVAFYEAALAVRSGEAADPQNS